jgi:hypothetical protein
MPHPKALTPMQMHQAAELYREGKSRRQVAAALKCSETAVRTALIELGVPFRGRRHASAQSNRRRAGHYRKSQLVSSVFQLGAIA